MSCIEAWMIAYDYVPWYLYHIQNQQSFCWKYNIKLFMDSVEELNYLNMLILNVECIWSVVQWTQNQTTLDDPVMYKYLFFIVLADKGHRGWAICIARDKIFGSLATSCTLYRNRQEIFVSCKTLGMRAHEQFLSQPLIVFIFCFVFSFWQITFCAARWS